MLCTNIYTSLRHINETATVRLKTRTLPVSAELPGHMGFQFRAPTNTSNQIWCYMSRQSMIYHVSICFWVAISCSKRPFFWAPQKKAPGSRQGMVPSNLGFHGSPETHPSANPSPGSIGRLKDCPVRRRYTVTLPAKSWQSSNRFWGAQICFNNLK